MTAKGSRKVGILVTEPQHAALARQALEWTGAEGIVFEVPPQAQLKGLRDLESLGVAAVLVRPSAVEYLSSQSKVPVLPYSVVGFDVLLAILKASKLGVPVAVLRFGGVPVPVDAVGEATGVTVLDCQASPTPEGARIAIERAVADGARSLVAGHAVAKIAAEAPVPVVQAEMSAASFADAIFNAMRLASRHEEMLVKVRRVEGAFEKLSEDIVRSRRAAVAGSFWKDFEPPGRDEAFERVRAATGDTELALEAYCLPEDALKWAAEVSRREEPLVLTGSQGTGKRALACLIHSLGRRARTRMATWYPGSAASLEDVLGKLGQESAIGMMFVPEAQNLSLQEQSALLDYHGEERRAIGLAGRWVRWPGPRIVLSCEGGPGSPSSRGKLTKEFLGRLTCLAFSLKSLRSRSSEAASLADDVLWAALDDSLKPRLAFLKAAAGEDRLFPEEARKSLSSYDWPGNARELVSFCRNVAIKISIASPSSFEEMKSILADAPSELLPAEDAPAEEEVPVSSDETSFTVTEGSLDEMVDQILVELLSRSGWNRTRVAKKLGISRTTLWKRLRTLASSEGEGG